MSEIPTKIFSAEAIQLPLLPLRDVVVFPHMVVPLFVGRAKSIKALETATQNDKSIMLVAQKTASKDEPSTKDLYEVGCIATVLQLLKLPDGTVKVLVEGVQRAQTQQVDDDGTQFMARVLPIAPEYIVSAEVEALRRTIISQFDQYVKFNKKIPQEIVTTLSNIDEAGRLVDTI